MRLARNHSSGFSLVELAVVLLASGILIAGAAKSYFIYQNSEKYKQTLESIDLIEAALNEFVARQSRYPCPAPLTAGPGDANFGKEDCAGAISTTGRDADSDGFADTVLIGTIPFETLINPDNNNMTADGIFAIKLPESSTVDGWRRRITYVVTQKLTVSSTFSDQLGAISVIDEHNRSVIDPEGSAHIAIVSHGPNGVGAYSREGNLVLPCPATGATPNEAENCDNNDGLFLSGLRNDNAASFNDDITQFFMVSSQSLWKYIVGSGGETRIINTNPGYVGIGETSPASQLHISGDLRAQDALALEFCNDADICMPAAVIGGALPQMNCKDHPLYGSPNYAVTGIEDKSVTCEPLFPTGFSSLECPPGEFAVGISTVSGVICDVP